MKPVLLTISIVVFYCNPGFTVKDDARILKHIQVISQAGDARYAEQLLESALLKNPNSSDLKEYQVAFKDRKQKALQSIKEIQGKIDLAHYPMANFKYFYQLGYLWYLVGDDVKAVNFFEKSLALKSTNSLAECSKGLAQERLGMRKEALASLTRARNLDPADPLANFHLALFYIRNSNASKALKISEIFKEKWPQYFKTINDVLKVPQ